MLPQNILYMLKSPNKSKKQYIKLVINLWFFIFNNVKPKIILKFLNLRSLFMKYDISLPLI